MRYGALTGRVVRSVNAPSAATWVEAVLSNRPDRARKIALNAGGVPFRLARSLADMRSVLHGCGARQSGLLASSQARRLRAEGLGGVLPHQDAVARWFLDRWPDLRSADALEVVATEFCVQGLELRYYGASATKAKLHTLGRRATYLPRPTPNDERAVRCSLHVRAHSDSRSMVSQNSAR